MAQIKGKVGVEHNIIGKLQVGQTITATLSNGFFYLDPYEVSVANGYTGTLEEWIAEYVSYGEYINFYISDDGYLMGEYDPERYSFYIYNGNLIAEKS